MEEETCEQPNEFMEMVGEVSSMLTLPKTGRRIVLDARTVALIQAALDRIETGHGSVTIEVKRSRISGISSTEHHRL